MNTKELLSRLRETQSNLIRYNASGESVGIHAIPPHTKYLKNVKKDIARAKTILHERGIKC